MKYSLVIMLFLVLQVFAYANQALSTAAMRDVQEKVETLNERYGANRVLVVFDIDNTLLAMEGPLGSDQWFSWQENMLFSSANPTENPNLCAKDFPGLLKAQGLLFYLKHMQTPEKNTFLVIKTLQNAGNNVVALTSRGYDFRYQTSRELLLNRIDLSTTAKRYVTKFITPTKAFNPSTVFDQYGFDTEKTKDYKLATAREVQYLDGVFYTSGQHKGVMLKILLQEAALNPLAIVFVDDKLKHTQRVQAVFANSSIETVTFHYTKEDQKVSQFNAGDKSAVIDGWNAIDQDLKQAYGL